MWTFPLPIYRSNLPLKGHPGAFGTVRRHDIHTGVDLYCPVGTEVLAVESGKVVLINLFTGPKVGSPWWYETYFVAIAGVSGIVVYGEICPNVTVGQSVQEGQMIGHVAQVLTKDKGKPLSMLHLELYNKLIDPVVWNLSDPKPLELLDPSEHLLLSLTKK